MGEPTEPEPFVCVIILQESSDLLEQKHWAQTTPGQRKKNALSQTTLFIR